MYEMKEFDKATADYQIGLKIRTFDYEIDDNKYDMVIDYYSRVLKNEPNDYKALFYRGLAYQHKEEKEMAIADFTAAIEIRPNLYEALFYRGYAHETADQTIADYSAALKIKPDYYDALLHRGFVYQARAEDRQFDAIANTIPKTTHKEFKKKINEELEKNKNSIQNMDAIEDFSAAITIKPDWFAAFQNRARAYASRGDYNQAIEDYTVALELAPETENYLILRHRSKIYTNNENYDMAIDDLNAAFRINPRLYDVIFERGVNYYKKGDYNQAIEDWEAYLQYFPNEPPVMENLEIVRNSPGEEINVSLF